MILATFMERGAATLGLVDRSAGSVLALQAQHLQSLGKRAAALEDMLALIDAGPAGLELVSLVAQKAKGDPAHVRALNSVRLLSPVPVPRQIREFSVYEQHVRDAPMASARAKARFTGLPVDPAMINRPVPKVFYQQPAYYHCNRFNVIGHEQDIEWPSYSGHLDYELEIGMFLGRGGKNLKAGAATDCIFGYTIFNDVSARESMWREMDTRMGPTKGKSFDTANVIGPWIVTRDEIPDVQDLAATVRVNGEIWGRNTTASMLHSFEDMIAYVSRDETLHAGEFFGSGTVGGCSGMEADRWLKDGDLIELELGGIGVLRNRIVKRAGN